MIETPNQSDVVTCKDGDVRGVIWSSSSAFPKRFRPETAIQALV